MLSNGRITINNKMGSVKKMNFLNTQHYFIQYVNVIIEDTIQKNDKDIWTVNYCKLTCQNENSSYSSLPQRLKFHSFPSFSIR
jgi:hypothetical protein